MRTVYDLVDLRPVILAARQLAFSDDTLEGYLPSVSVADVDYRLGRANRMDQTVPARAFDTPAPIIARPGALEVRGGLPAFSAMDLLTETDLIRARRMAGLPVDLSLDVAASAARAVATILNTMELLRGQALFTGQIALAENGVRQTVDFGVTNQVAAGTALTDASAPAATYLENWLDAYISKAGGSPGIALTSRRMVRLLLRNTSLINATAGATSGRSSITLQELNGWLAGEGFPEFRTYDRSLKGPDGSVTRVTPDNRIALLPDPGTRVGETQYGITEEAVELVTNRVLAAEQAPGIAVVTQVSDNPVQKGVLGASIGLPIVQDPDAVLIAVAA